MEGDEAFLPFHSKPDRKLRQIRSEGNAMNDAARESSRCPDQTRAGLPDASAGSHLSPSLSLGGRDVSPLPTLDSLRILVVDDEPMVREIVRLFLEEDRCSMTMAVNGRDGLARFREGEFDVVLTDRAMPEMDGNELARAIKKLKPGQPIILLTGYNTGALEDSSVDLVVAKPFTMDRLRGAIRQALHRV
jgi:CheY-like chemotaxis protein